MPVGKVEHPFEAYFLNHTIYPSSLVQQQHPAIIDLFLRHPIRILVGLWNKTK
jgi:hypothetical protein